MEPSAAENFVQVPTTVSSQIKVENNNDSASDLRAETGKFPVEWDFSSKVPKSQYRPPIEIPAEPLGYGVNRNVYYVCSDLFGEWIELPPATPHQINVSRRIKKYLTGSLDHHISSFPSFPGLEKNYLRVLIARISAGTSISPRNFYKIGSNSEKDEEFDDDASVDDDDDDDDDGSLSKFIFITKECYWKLFK